MSNDSTMARLRRANPVPEPPAADDSELFDRITALPQDAPASKRREGPSRRQRHGLVLVLAALIAVLLASTAFAISQWLGGDVVEPPVTRQEFLDAQRHLDLPPGVVWPKIDVPDDSVTIRGGGGGAAVFIAMNAWECHWVDAIRGGDVAAGERAHDELNRLLANNVFEAPAGAPEGWVPSPLPSVPFAVFAADGGLDRTRRIYARAADGHPGGLAQSCRANAP
ncbi:MAG: hypothetical protein ACRDHU_14695 [Actinomycetota bacterium]